MKSFAAVKKQSSIMRSFILDPIVGSDVNILVVAVVVAFLLLKQSSGIIALRTQIFLCQVSKAVLSQFPLFDCKLHHIGFHVAHYASTWRTARLQTSQTQALPCHSA